jgi:NADH:ubiquinone reductase (H+-translocating)
MSQPVRIVIAGGGIAGILLATKLGDQLGRSGRASVALIDNSPTHIWKPMLHTIAAGTRDVQQQQIVYLAHARKHGFTYLPGEVRGLDRERRCVELGEIRTQEGAVIVDSRTVEYDILVMSLGSRANDFGVPGVRSHCHFIDSQQQAENFNVVLRNHILRSVAKDESLRVGVVGAGATGVELSAELSRLLEVVSRYGDPSVRSRLNLTLLESGPRVLASFPPQISASSQQQLERIGFRVMTSTQVISADTRGFYHNGSLVEADLMVWAAGVKVADFMNNLAGLETSRSNQLIVDSTLQTTRDDHVFAVGDCASLTPEGHERPLPPTAQVATQQAEHLARHLPGWIEGKPLPEFQFRDFGSLVSLSDYAAYGALGRVGFFKGGIIRGRAAHLGHALLYRRHQRALHGLSKATLMWAAEQVNGLVKPKVRLA